MNPEGNDHVTFTAFFVGDEEYLILDEFDYNGLAHRVAVSKECFEAVMLRDEGDLDDPRMAAVAFYRIGERWLPVEPASLLKVLDHSQAGMLQSLGIDPRDLT